MRGLGSGEHGGIGYPRARGGAAFSGVSRHLRVPGPGGEMARGPSFDESRGSGHSIYFAKKGLWEPAFWWGAGGLG